MRKYFLNSSRLSLCRTSTPEERAKFKNIATKLRDMYFSKK